MPVLAYDFPLLSMFWVLFVASWMFIIVFMVIWAFIDNFRRHDHGGWSKAGWALIIVLIPLFGTLIYIVARPSEPRAVA
jgi:hypothetical protein